ncbi:exodeoxyribonuclease III [Clostridium sediminicola]|uniref:exodeoxyribonuclease III n=1 Tax=Clostridium sediminicola TaxID=3114879 RepID=UPI0031F1CEA7
MKFYSWNVNGLRAIDKKGFFEWLENEQPDILGIQETKLQENQLTDKMKEIEGYYSYFSFAEKKGYSGVAVYTKIEPKSVKHGIGIERFDSEGRILILEYDEFTLFNIYFPNGQMSEERLQYKLDFYEELFKYCEDLRTKGKKLVIFGDYNTAHNEIDLKNPKPNSKRSGFLPIERKWMDKIINKGYIDTFRYLYPEEIQYSWWSYRFKAREKNAGWRIDYHFVTENFKENIVDAKILGEVQGSDHCPVVLECQF